MITNLPDRIEHLPIESLVPYARNSRTHSDDQVAKIAASLLEFGFTNPVLIDVGGGHYRRARPRHGCAPDRAAADSLHSPGASH